MTALLNRLRNHRQPVPTPRPLPVTGTDERLATPAEIDALIAAFRLPPATARVN